MVRDTTNRGSAMLTTKTRRREAGDGGPGLPVKAIALGAMPVSQQMALQEPHILARPHIKSRPRRSVRLASQAAACPIRTQS